MTEQLISNQTSSIGAVWPPRVDTTHHRLRGFYAEGVVRTEADIDTFAAHFDAARIITQTTEGIDRLTVRVVAHAGALATLDRMGIHVEAALPLARTEPSLVVAYTAANLGGRAMSQAHLARHRDTLAGAIRRPRPTQNPAAALRAQGFTPHLVDHQDAKALAPRFAELYASFNYVEADIVELLGNTDNTIAYVQDGDRIVSTAMAESASIRVAGLEPLNLVEITDASTVLDYRGRGLYKGVSGYLADRLQHERDDLNVLYGESNLAMRGVLFAAHENGRRFSHFDNYGVLRPDFGILQQNFHVADGAETRAYNDFALSYYPLS
jgi:hypothetical protein